MLEAWLQTIVEQGILGVLLVIVGWAYWKKDQEIGELHREKLDLAKKVVVLAQTLTELIEANDDK